MTTTYSGDPSTSEKDRVRFLLGATKEPWLFTDEEIHFVIDEQGNVYGAAAELAIIKSTEYTDKKSKTVGPLSVEYGEVSDRWLKLAQGLRRRSSRTGGATAITTQVNRPDHFRLGIHDSQIPLPDKINTDNR